VQGTKYYGTGAKSSFNANMKQPRVIHEETN
jgi:hypothetical protein